MLTADTPLRVKGIAGEWLRVELPEGITGFIHESLVQPIPNALYEYQAAERKIIRTRPSAFALAAGLVNAEDVIAVFTEYKSWQLVLSGNESGWIETGT